MAAIDGTSQVGGQLVLPFSVLSIAQLQLQFLSNIESRPERVGYGYVIVRSNAAPNPKRIVFRTPVMLPGYYFTFPNNLGFSANTYGFWVNWERSGIPYRIGYD